jgi:MFS family permease
MLIPIMPGFAQEHLGLSYTQYSIVMVVGGGSAVLGMVPMGKLSDRFGKKWFLVLGFLLFALSVGLLPSSQSFGPSLGLAFVLGLSYAAVLPSWNALMATYVPEDQKGVGWGLLSTVEGIGVMIGPVFGGWLATMFGLPVTLLTAAGMFAFLTFFYAVMPFQYETKRGSQQAA